MRCHSFVFRFLQAFPYVISYEGDDSSGADDNSGNNPGNDSQGNDGDDEELPPSAKGKSTFTQEEFNRALKEDRKRHKAQLEKAKAETSKQIKALEALQKSKNLSEKDKAALEAQIEDLRNSQLTSKELAAKEKEKLERTHKEQVAVLTGERDTWQRRFTQGTINTVLISEAAKAEAFDPDAIIAILGPNTRLAEDLDEEGNGTGTFTPKVKFSDVDKDGKPVSLDLTAEQAVKRMKDTPKYGYLFKSTALGGLGAGGGLGKSSGNQDVTKMTAEQYREYRKKIGLARPGK